MTATLSFNQITEIVVAVVVIVAVVVVVVSVSSQCNIPILVDMI